MEFFIAIVIALVAILIVVQVMIRKHFVFDSHLDPASALRVAAAALGGGQSFIDASGALSIPLGGDRILSVAAEPQGPGSRLEIWLSSYDFMNANGFQVVGYHNRARRIMRACGA